MIFDIIVFDGVDELDALAPLEVLRHASKLGADLSVRLVTRLVQDEVVGAHGLRFRPDAVYQPGSADAIIVSGGGWAARAPQGAWAEVQSGEWLPLLAEARHTTELIASVCTGSMMLAHAGVIGNRRATTHHAAWDDLVATGATLVDERVVDDGDLVTSGGVTSGLDLALWLVAREFSPDIAAQVADRLEYTSRV
jgi:transcriptional regulator GlxA family with amidase domain